jgi:hypothetical protein
MKKMRILAAMAAVACLWACTKPEANTPGGNNNDTPGGNGQDATVTLTVSPTTVEYEAEGGVRRVSVTTNQADYTVTGNPDWLTVDKNGAEVTLTAAANTVNQARNCTLTVTAGDKTATVEVNQKAGSPVQGFKNCKVAVLEYMGTTLYQFMKPTEEDYGGAALLCLSDEDENNLVLWIYTDLFASPEEVTLTPGKYTKGEDNYAQLKLAAKKLTFMAGVSTGVDDEDAYVAGCYFAYPLDGEKYASIPLVDGTIDVVANNDGTFTIKADMVDGEGKDYKYAFEGNVVINAEEAGYPGASDRLDVTENILYGVCYYRGDNYGKGTANFILQFYAAEAGSEQPVALSQFEFNTELVEFAEDMDLSGVYNFPDDGAESGTPIELYSAGSLVPGYLEHFQFGDYSFDNPSGTSVQWFQPSDYELCDLYGFLMLTKEADGKYSFMASQMSSTGYSLIMMGLPAVDIYIQNATDAGGDD